MYRTSTQCIGLCHMTHLTNGQKNDNCHSVQVQCEKGLSLSMLKVVMSYICIGHQHNV